MPKQVTPGLNSMLQSTLIKIDEQMHAIQNEFESHKHEVVEGTTVWEMKSADGTNVMTPLLLARSNILLAIALNNKE